MSGLRPPKSLVEKIANLDLDSPSVVPHGSLSGSRPGSVAGSQLGSRADSRGNTAPGSSKADAGGQEPLRPIDLIAKRVDLPADAYLPSDDKFRFTRRPGFNTVGKPIQVQLNLFPVKGFNEQQTIYQYDVSVSPNPRESRALVKKVWSSPTVKEKLQQMGGKWLYDGNKLAWSSKEIPRNEFRVTVDLDTDKPSKRNVATTGVYYVHVRQSKKVHLHFLHEYLQGKIAWDNRVLEGMNVIDHCMRQTAMDNVAEPRKKPVPGERSMDDINRMIQIRRNFYPEEARTAFLGSGSSLELRKGYYAAARLSESKQIMINMDTVNTAFWMAGQCLGEVGLSMFNAAGKEYESCKTTDWGRYLKPEKVRDPRNVNKWIWKQSFAFTLLRRLQKLKFQVRHRNRYDDFKVYTIKNFMWKEEHCENGGANALNVTFDKKMPDGTTKTLTIEKYFDDKYDCMIMHPELPLIETTRGAFFPMEVCWVAGYQRYPYKLDAAQTAQMIKFAVTRPEKRLEDINDGAKALSYHNDPYLREYGIHVSSKMQITNARLIKNPEILFGGTDKLNPQMTGRWDLRGKRFFEPNASEVVSWGFVVCGTSCRKDEAESFASKFNQAYKAHGGKTKAVIHIVFIPFSFGDYGEITYEAYFQVKKKFNIPPQMMFFVVQNKNAMVYERIKKSMDCRFCCPSQILIGGHVAKANPQYISNVAMKVNAKLGGSTCVAAPLPKPGAGRPDKSPYFKVPTMMIGVDVSHASPGSGAPSMAALTVSMDRYAARYSAACQTNGWRDEVLHPETVNDAFSKLLGWWINHHKTVPQHVYYFRDGIDEGQFRSVIDQEVRAFRRVFREKNAGTPKFTVIIATKRHHIRFFPKKGDRDTGDRNGNALPGTVVEHDATHPHHFDFYLCSHVAIQGTARPVHYQVIYDDANVSPDELQTMIYHQCYQYVRSTTPVSLHPAIYYAHLASNRARAHEPIYRDMKERPSTIPGHPLAKHYSEVYPDKHEVQLNKAPKLHPMAGEIEGTNPAFMNTTMWYI